MIDNNNNNNSNIRKSSSPQSLLAPLPDNPTSLQTLLEESTYAPSEAQRLCKIRFLSRLKDNPLLDPSSLTLEDAVQLSGSTTLKNWWGKPGFKAWFLNLDEYRERVELAFATALDAIQDILMNTEPKAQSARVNLIKTIIELAGRMPNKNKEKYADDEISKMTPQQLQEYIHRNRKVIEVQPTVD
jgi:hypothetical protein